jgi:hypothetical protein
MKFKSTDEIDTIIKKFQYKRNPQKLIFEADVIEKLVDSLYPLEIPLHPTIEAQLLIFLKINKIFKENELNNHILTPSGNIIERNLIYDEIKRIFKNSLKYNSIKMTNLSELSDLKQGKSLYFTNLRYIEFIYNEKTHSYLKLEAGNKKFLVALGTDRPTALVEIPSHYELYFFRIDNLENFNEEALIESLESALVGILAERFKIRIKWIDAIDSHLKPWSLWDNIKENLNNGISSEKYPYSIKKMIGKYGGLVYITYLSSIKPHKIFTAEEIRLYLKRIISRSYFEVGNRVIFEIMNRNQDIQKIIDDLEKLNKNGTNIYTKLKSLQSKLKLNFHPSSKINEITFRQMILHKEANCRGYVILSLYFFIRYQYLFHELTDFDIKIYCVDPENLNTFLEKEQSHPHIFIGIKSNEESILDPTGIFDKISEPSRFLKFLNDHEFYQKFFLPKFEGCS